MLKYLNHITNMTLTCDTQSMKPEARQTLANEELKQKKVDEQNTVDPLECRSDTGSRRET